MLTVNIIGHTGCQKCAMLNRRTDTLLQQEPYKSLFRKVYHDTEDPSGMEAREEALSFFCKCQCVNPNRIPAFIITDENGEFLPCLECTHLQGVHLYQYIGIQTDYTEGGGILPPETIKETLDEAIAYMDKRDR